jgi:hypothetical protein
MRSVVETITPEKAAAMLERAKPNRAINEHRAVTIARDMQVGRWGLNGETIIVAPNGRILDGQHRLTACVIADMPFQSFVVYDVPEDMFDTIDSGRTRSASDILRAKGFDATPLAAAASRYTMNYISGINVAAAIPRLNITRFVENHPYITTVAKVVDAKCKRLHRTALTAVLFLANTNRSYEQEMLSFLDGLNSGAALEKGDPRLTLRTWYFDEVVRARKGVGISTITAFGATVRAWNAYVSNKPLLSLRALDNPSKDTMPIIGFERVKYRDIPENSKPAPVNDSNDKDKPVVRQGHSLPKQRDLFEVSAA